MTAKPALDATRCRIAVVRELTRFISSYLYTQGCRIGRSPNLLMIPRPAWEPKSDTIKTVIGHLPLTA
jgi:hypothetical protein